jgi:uncharacterized protein (DUF1697 family)
MRSNQYLALLRGINVGGSNIIKMTDLKTCFEKMGFEDVLTFIQSGNVLFRSGEKSIPKLTGTIEKGLSGTFRYDSRVVVVLYKHLERVVHEAPRGFGKDDARFRYDVIFLKEPLTAKSTMKSVTTKEGVDRVHEGKGVLYVSRLIAKASQSRLSKIISLPIYQAMTIRNWNTTTKLLALMEKRA